MALPVSAWRRSLLQVAIVAAACGAILAASPARAQLVDDERGCGRGRRSTIASETELLPTCTAAIAAGRYRGGELALAYVSRGRAHYNLGQPERAIADYGEAIRIDPALVLAYARRAEA